MHRMPGSQAGPCRAVLPGHTRASSSSSCTGILPSYCGCCFAVSHKQTLQSPGMEHLDAVFCVSAADLLLCDAAGDAWDFCSPFVFGYLRKTWNPKDSVVASIFQLLLLGHRVHVFGNTGFHCVVVSISCGCDSAQIQQVQVLSQGSEIWRGFCTCFGKLLVTSGTPSLLRFLLSSLMSTDKGLFQCLVTVHWQAALQTCLLC